MCHYGFFPKKKWFPIFLELRILKNYETLEFLKAFFNSLIILGIKPYMHIHELGILRLCIHEPGIQYLGLPRWGPNRFPFFHAVKAPINVRGIGTCDCTQFKTELTGILYALSKSENNI